MQVAAGLTLALSRLA